MINTGVATTVGTEATAIVTVPAGPCVLVLSNTGTGTVLIGTSDALDTTNGNGFPLPAGATITVPGYPGSNGVTIYGISAADTNVVGALISTTG